MEKNVRKFQGWIFLTHTVYCTLYSSCDKKIDGLLLEAICVFEELILYMQIII